MQENSELSIVKNQEHKNQSQIETGASMCRDN